MAVHAHRERLQAAQHQPRVERPGNGAERLLEERQPLGDPSSGSRRSRRRRRSGRRGTSSSSGRRCRRRARAAAGDTESRTCCRRRRARPRRAPTRDAAAMSTMFSSRVRRRLQPHERVRSSRCSARPSASSSGREREAVALGLVDLREHAVDAAVHVVDRDDVVARRQQVHERRRGAEPRGECTPCAAPSSDARHSCSAVRVGLPTRA